MRFEYVVNFMHEMRKDEIYEEKSIMYGNGSNHTADTDSIGGTLAMASK